MCGISGIITREKLTDDLRAAISRVNEAQIHRGPDGAGEYSGNQVMLAMRRLSIIDPQSGWQPLYNEDKSIVLIINGEIYNYIELRERLQNSGHRFRTNTDGEVILHLYEENELDFIRHLRGMFAFALWDEKRQRLILARDRMGEKPLYLFERDGELMFASELKGLLSSGLVPFELDPSAVDLYFHYQYVPEPLTPLKGVRKLDAARMLIVDAKNWKTEETEYWRMEDASPLDGEPGRLIRGKLEEVGHLIVRSDVPVGVALSGGLDSSIVAALAAKQKKDICAFTVGYAGRPACDEREDAKVLAHHLKLPLYEIELDTQSIVDFFPQLNFWRDDPIADISGFGYYAVMKLASERSVPVLLQGQGGDELFWGYPQVRQAAQETFLKTALLNKPLSETIFQTLKLRLPDNFSAQSISGWMKNLAGFRSNLMNVRRHRANPRRMVFYDLSPDFIEAASKIKSYYSAVFLDQIRENDPARLFTFNEGWKSVDVTLTKLVCETYLRENGITQGDRLGMASSVEMRLPLIDYQFVETVIGLRKAQSDVGLPPKHWLKEAVSDILPQAVLDRPKRGFEPPVREWHAALFKSYGESLRDGFLVGAHVLSGEGGRILSKGEFSPKVTSPLSFKALVLEQWCRQMLKVY